MPKLKPIYAISMAFVSLTSYTMPGLTSDSVSYVSHNPRVHFVQQPQLPDNGTPTGRRKGAAGRGNCVLEPPLTALVPTSEKSLAESEGKVTYVWGKTIAEYPTFWFYVPYSNTSLLSVEFVLQDGENDVYRTPVTLPRTPGIVSFRLPSTAKPLEIGKMYHWFFKVNVDCALQPPAKMKDYVEGWVQRVKLNPIIASQLETATPQQQIAIYAANGIWHEALTSLVDLRLVNTEDTTLKNDWTDLLQSAGLSDIASKPIVQCCNLKNAFPLWGLKSVKEVNRSE